jgi:hypothetical protein
MQDSVTAPATPSSQSPHMIQLRGSPWGTPAAAKVQQPYAAQGDPRGGRGGQDHAARAPGAAGILHTDKEARFAQ